MGLVLRTEKSETHLQALENESTAAASQGAAALEAFEEASFKKAAKEAPQLGIGEAPTGGSSSSDDSGSSDSFSSDSGGSDDFSFDDSGPDETPEEGSEDPEEESEEEPDPEPEEEEEPEEEKARTEAWRNGLDFPAEGNIRMESFGEIAGVIGGGLWSGMSFVATALGTIGLRWTPALLNGFLKITLFTFAKSFSLLSDLSDNIAIRYTRFTNRSEKLQERLKASKEAVQLIVVSDAKLREKALPVTQNLQILHYSDSVDVTKNLDRFKDFFDSNLIKLGKTIKGEFQALNTIAGNRYLRREYDAMDSMRLNPSAMGFKPDGWLEGEAPTDQSFVAPYISEEMIGYTQLRAWFPKEHYDTWDNIEKAYNQSRIVITSSTDARSDEKGPILTPVELTALLTAIEGLMGAMEKHKVLYEEVSDLRTGFAGKLKQLFVRLAQDHTKVSFRNSTALPLYLKSAFVSKVYILGAMDLHDHAGRVVSNALSFVDATAKRYRVDA